MLDNLRSWLRVIGIFKLINYSCNQSGKNLRGNNVLSILSSTFPIRINSSFTAIIFIYLIDCIKSSSLANICAYSTLALFTNISSNFIDNDFDNESVSSLNKSTFRPDWKIIIAIYNISLWPVKKPFSFKHLSNSIPFSCSLLLFYRTMKL